jgi:hypothetical protein
VRTSTLRRGALVAVVGAIALALTGCAAVGVPTHIDATAVAAKELAAHLKASPGVVSASAAYNPADPEGESLRVGVQLKTGSSAADWTGVLHTARAALTRDPLGQTRRSLTVTQRGASGPEFVPRQYVNWPTTADIQKSFTGWYAVEAATGLDLRFALADGSDPVQYQLTSQAQSALFMSGTAAVQNVPSDTALLGYGFDTTIAPTAGARAVYALLSQKLPPMEATAEMTTPVGRRFMVAWGPAGTIASGTVATIYAPKSAGPHPAQADVSLAVRLVGAVPELGLAVSWVGAKHTAWVTFGACPESTKRTPTPDDQAFASQIAATGYSIPPSGGAGECLP